MSNGIETFYIDLHTAMYELGKIDQAPFPTAHEFREFLRQSYPTGLHSMECLDAGCGGTAINSYSMATFGTDNVAAIDINAQSLALAESRMSNAGIRGVTFKCGSLMELPYRDDQFELVVCSGVAHHTPDPLQVVHELYRVAKPGSTLYISVYCFEGSWMSVAVRVWRALAWVIPFRLAHTLFKYNRTINNFVLDHMYVPILWIYRASDFRKILQQSGFRVISETQSKMDPFSDRKIFGKTVSGDGLLRIFVARKD